MAAGRAPAGSGTQGGSDPTRVRFGPDFLPRLERLVARGRAARGREAGAGRSRTLGPGDELLGYRPYRAGEELRHLDWGLLARSERAFVRVFRREAGERWELLLDASGSMGLGLPGKLQRAAEVATALAFSGLAAGAKARLHVAQPSGVRSLTLGRVAELSDWMRALEELRAVAPAGMRTLLAGPRHGHPARIFVVGDLLDLEPVDVVALARPGRRVDLVRVLAPHELSPAGAEDSLGAAAVRWVDPETGAGLGVRLDGPLTARYERALEARLSAWDRLARRGRLGHTVWSSARPFEEVVQGVLGGGRVILGWYFARPALLAALFLPLLVWWLARRPGRPAEAATGTLEIWREVASELRPAGTRRQHRAPWLLLGALTLGALALAGPRAARARPPTWRILVDRSPSMYLPHRDGGTRLERALVSLADELDRLESDERLWLAFDGQDFVAIPGEAVPRAWLQPPARPHPEPDWARLDQPWTVWVSDDQPPCEPQEAGLVLAGGAAVPGLAAVGPAGELLAFDGQELVPAAEQAGPRAVSIGPSVAQPIRVLAELWARERGLLLQAQAPGVPVALALEGPPEELSAGTREPMRVGRDGWELEIEVVPESAPRAAPGAPGDFELALLPWLEAGGEVQVGSAPGRVVSSFTRTGAPLGDPAAFALSWAALFDASLLPPPGIVSVEERLGAGPSLVRLGAGDPEAAQGGGPSLEALLAGAATLLVLLGLLRARLSGGVIPR